MTEMAAGFLRDDQGGPTLPVPLDQHKAIVADFAYLRGVLVCEELYAMCWDNFEDIGKQLSTAINARFRPPGVPSWHERIGHIQDFNRHLSNFLTTFRQYVDVSAHALKQIDPALKAAFDTSTCREYDSRVGYAALSAARNYVQHRGFFARSWTTKIDGGRLSVQLTIDVQTLRKDEKFKKGLLPRLAPLGEQIDILFLLHDCMTGICAVQKDLRSSYTPRVASGETLLRQVVGEYCAARGVPPHPLLLLDSPNDKEPREVLGTDLYARLGWLRKRYRV